MIEFVASVERAGLFCCGEVVREAEDEVPGAFVCEACGTLYSPAEVAAVYAAAQRALGPEVTADSQAPTEYTWCGDARVTLTLRGATIGSNFVLPGDVVLRDVLSEYSIIGLIDDKGENDG